MRLSSHSTKHMQIRGTTDSKLPIGVSVTYYVNLWLPCDKLAACPDCFPAFVCSETPQAEWELEVEDSDWILCI